MMTISVSKGNVKMGEIKSVSLPPIVTCEILIIEILNST